MKTTFLAWRNYLLILLPLFVMSACGGGGDAENPRAQIAGDNMKSWKIKKEMTASGEKDKVTSEEKDQRMEFYANGTFKIEADNQFEGGRWNYNAGAKTMELVFNDRADTKEVFQVLELDDNTIKLQANDGSTMELKKD